MNGMTNTLENFGNTRTSFVGDFTKNLTASKFTNRYTK
jgi:hypothetical protein